METATSSSRCRHATELCLALGILPARPARLGCLQGARTRSHLLLEAVAAGASSGARSATREQLLVQAGPRGKRERDFYELVSAELQAERDGSPSALPGAHPGHKAPLKGRPEPACRVWCANTTPCSEAVRPVQSQRAPPQRATAQTWMPERERRPPAPRTRGCPSQCATACCSRLSPSSVRPRSSPLPCRSCLLLFVPSYVRPCGGAGVTE